MKILHATKKYPNALGGDAIVVSNLEKQQKKAGHKVTILTTNCNEIKAGKDIYKFGLKDTPIALDRITPKRLFSLGMLYFQVFKVFKTERPDVIHTHSIDMAFFISFAARHYKIPIVHTFHIVTFNDPKQSFLRRKSELFLLRRSKLRKVFVLNPSNVESFAKAGIHNAVFVPNGVNIEEWQTSGRKAKNKKFTFIAVGRLEEQKGFTYLIEAAARLRKLHDNFQVQIVGIGSLQEQLQKQILVSGLSDFVYLLGQRSPRQLKDLYTKSDVFVLPSLWEGMPLTLLEAWAASLVVIATDVGNISYLSQGAAILVPSGSPEELYFAMKGLIEDDNLRKIIGLLGRKRVNRYRWEVIASKFSMHYGLEA